MKKNIEWEDEIVMNIYYQELIPADELMKYIRQRQMVDSIIEEAQDND